MYSSGEATEIRGFQSVELIYEIPKKNLRQTFLQLEIVLKCLNPSERANKFEEYLDRMGIEFKNHVWHQPIID